MGLRSWLVDRLARGPVPAERDPDEEVELIVLPLARASLLVAELEGGGVAARYEESFDLLTRSLTNGRVLVARRDAERARQLLDDPETQADDDA